MSQSEGRSPGTGRSLVSASTLPALLLTFPFYEPTPLAPGRKAPPAAQGLEQAPATSGIPGGAGPELETGPSSPARWRVGLEVVLKPGVPAPGVDGRPGPYRYRIERLDGDRLYLSSQGSAGWVRAADVLPAGEAVPYHSRAIREDPKAAWAFARRALARYAEGAFDRAIADLDEAIRLDPERASHYSNRGSVRLETGDYGRAVDDFDRAIRLDPNSASARYGRGLARQRQGQLARALDDYNEAIRLRPKFARAFNNRGLIRHDTQEYNRAIDDYNEAIRLDPDDPLPYNNRGSTRESQGDAPRALADYSEAIRLDPKYVKAYANRGTLRESQGDFAGALADFSEATRLDPKGPSAFRRVAWIRASCPDPALRDGQAALTAATRARALSGRDDRETLEALAAAEAESGQFEAAVRHQAEAIRLLPSSSAGLSAARSRLALYRSGTPYRQKPPRP